MSQWVFKGLKTGIKTTHYPARQESGHGVTPGRPTSYEYDAEAARVLVERCPTGALSQCDGQVAVEYRRCVHCYRCLRGTPHPLPWELDHEWAAWATESRNPERKLGKEFRRSIHVFVMDAGDCGACLHEVKQINNPYYNMHRLGFFITPTPRQADIMLVVGSVTDHLRLPLEKAYAAMPTPKRVLAVGACALSAGIFGPSFISGAGVAEVLPVDVEVPGHPPPPLAILHGLLLATGRRPSASLVSPAGIPTEVSGT
jgi:Ni,Fe-hydrogenase III small subunit/ferredoxin-like protein FixX